MNEKKENSKIEEEKEEEKDNFSIAQDLEKKEVEREENDRKLKVYKIFNKKVERLAFSRVLSVRYISHGAKGGRKGGYSVLIVVGDKKGSFGFGCTKSVNILNAIQKSENYAKKHMNFFGDVIKNKTIVFSSEGYYNSSSIKLFPSFHIKSLKASYTLRTVCEALGIERISSKVFGSKNRKNLIMAIEKAFFNLQKKISILQHRKKQLLSKYEKLNEEFSIADKK